MKTLSWARTPDVHGEDEEVGGGRGAVVRGIEPNIKAVWQRLEVE